MKKKKTEAKYPVATDSEQWCSTTTTTTAAAATTTTAAAAGHPYTDPIHAAQTFTSATGEMHENTFTHTLSHPLTRSLGP